MRSRNGKDLLLATGFLVAGILFLTLGSLLWPTPIGKLTLIIGLGNCGIAIAHIFFGVPKRGGWPSNEEMTNGIQPEAISGGVPLAPMLGLLGLIFIWMIEVLVLLAKLCSGGNWPASTKCWTVTGLTVVATLYELTLRKRHRIYDQPSPVLNNNLQSWAVVGLVVCYLTFCAWLLTPLPL